jgi:radical SAM superfamily enzyme YgiQ (UPF0313 family)
MKNVLTINVPFTAPWGLPYGSAVVNGILHHHGYNATTWDLSIDLTNQFRSHPDFAVLAQSFSIGGYVQRQISKSLLKQILIWTRQQLQQKINHIRPDIVCFSIFSSYSADFSILLTTIARQLAPEAYFIMGGRGLDNIESVTQMTYGQYFAKYLPINVAYVGDAENQLIEVLENRYQGCFVAKPVAEQDFIGTPPAHWSGIEFAKYDGYDNQQLRIPITASKGCVRECTFCDVAGSWPKYIYKKGEIVGNEIVDLYTKTGINKIEFTDNLVNGSINNFRAMNTVIAEKIPNTIDYLGYAICRTRQSMPESDFALASVAGARVFKVGIESGSEKVRNDMKKKFSNDDIDWFTTNCAKYNIRQTWLMFVGYPTETEQDFNESIRLLREYSALGRAGMIAVFLSSPMMLLSNSGFMRNHAEEYGIEHNKHDHWSNFFWTSSIYTDNTFDVRLERYKKFAKAIDEYGYVSPEQRHGDRQTEKYTQVESLEKIYQQYKHAKKTKVIPIIETNFNINQETHI